MESLIHYFGKSILYLDHATNMKGHKYMCICVCVCMHIHMQTFIHIYVIIIQINVNRDTINFYKTIKYLAV